MKIISKIAPLTLYLCGILLSTPLWSQTEGPWIHASHGITLFGELKYGADFKHFDYVNPDAPKGGTFSYGWGNTFDTLNSFIALGFRPAFRTLDAVLYDRLMVRSGDEPASLYGLLAKTITYPDDYSWVEFDLHDNARFHDGRPVTVEDVIFSLEILKSQGAPEFRNDYADVVEVKKTGPHKVRFIFREKNNRSLVYTIAQLPVLAKHFWKSREFNKPTLEPPLTSGPYKVTKVDIGHSYTLERVKDYWARDHPVNKGRHNFDYVRHDYFRDININFEAFMAGKYDLRWETLPHQWSNGYDVPAVKDGRLIKEPFGFSGPTLYAGLYMNQRIDKFKDPKVREALSNAYDFEWLNKTIYYDLYVRVRSHFDHTELANQGIPEGLELELLEPFRDQLDPRVFTQAWEPPKTDATQAGLRNNLRKAATLLKEAGWSMKDGKLISKQGQPLEFELLFWDPFFERIGASFVSNLKKLGITANMRIIDSAEWQNRMETFNYEMAQAFTPPQPLSPGAEQGDYWGSAAADQQRSRNWMGINSQVVDALIEKIVHAQDRATRVAATRAMDRVLCWGYYSIPTSYSPTFNAAYWNSFGRPEKEPTWLRLLWFASEWWFDPAKEAALEKAGGKRAK